LNSPFSNDFSNYDDPMAYAQFRVDEEQIAANGGFAPGGFPPLGHPLAGFSTLDRPLNGGGIQQKGSRRTKKEGEGKGGWQKWS
jgi:hypothetical protein